MSPAPDPGRTELHEEAYDVIEKVMMSLYTHGEIHVYVYVHVYTCMYWLDI